MKYLIIPQELVQKMKDMEFDGFNKLDPIKGEMNGKEVYFLQSDLKENKIFAKALADFKVCEIKEIETIEDKYFDNELKEARKGLDIMSLTRKTILTAKIIQDEKISK